MKIHPLCEIIPEMQADEFGRLVASIRTRGYDPSKPVVVYEGAILDGRNRYRAAMKVGVEPPTVQFSGTPTEAADLVAAENLDRRHLTVGQLAMVAAALAPYYEGEARARERAGTLASKDARGKAIEKAAEKVGVSTSSAERARAVQRAAPALAEKVKRGEVSLGAAARQARRRSEPPPEDAAPATVKDEMGEAVTDDRLISVFSEQRPRFLDLANRIHALKREVAALAAEPVGSFLSDHVQHIVNNLEHAARTVKADAPYAGRCPVCAGADRNKRGCRTCRGQKWVTKSVWETAPEDGKR